MTSLVHLTRNGAILWIEIDNPPVNAASQTVRQELMNGLLAARVDPSIGAVILCAAGRTFMAGADITEFDLTEIPQPDHSDVFNAVEALACPVIAAVHGTVLGGGLELSLAAHYRVALASTKLGLPEVKLGILPGAGGTQRLPRLAGVRAALDIMTGGVPISASKAKQLGIVDVVVEDGLRDAALALAVKLIEGKRQLRPTREITVDASTIEEGFFSSYAEALPPPDKGGLAAHAIVRCVKASLDLPFDEGLRLERAEFNVLKDTPESIALRHIFFAEREAMRIPGLPRDTTRREISSIGIVGAGTMGSGIAMCFANAGFPVTIAEVSKEALTKGLRTIQTNYESSLQKGRITNDEAQRRVGLISGVTDMLELRDCDLVIEAAFESLDVKRTICKQLGGICKVGAIIASNTSTLDINVLAEATGRPSDVVGMHFFSPAYVMRLLEVVRGDKTAPEVLATVMALAKTIGKSAVVSGVCYGFIGNRMLEPYLRETETLLMEGASPTQIDRAIEKVGLAMGPCRMIDMAGVDVAAKVVIERKKAGALAPDPSYRAVVQQLFTLGRLGQKSGAGYYRYEGRTPVEDPEVTAVCHQLAETHGIERRDNISDSEIVERCLFPLINEGAQILSEGIAYRAGDIDVVWVNGYGFPAYKGGPMHMLAYVGAAQIRERLAAYASIRGNAFGYWDISPQISGGEKLSLS